MTAARDRVGIGPQAAVLVAAVAGVVVGLASGVGGAATLAVAGGLVVAVGARSLVRPDDTVRALGSVGILLGSILVWAGASLGAAASAGRVGVVLLVALGAAGVALDALVDLSSSVEEAVRRSLRRSALVVLAGTCIALLGHAGVFTRLPAAILLAIAAPASGNPLFSLVVLQVLAVVTAIVLASALAALDRWLPGDDGDDPLAPLRAVGKHPTAIPPAVWGWIGLQAVVLLLAPSGGWFVTVLAVLGPLGAAVDAALSWGVFHLPLLAVCALAGAVVVARAAQVAVVTWADPNPAETLGDAAGGIVTVVLVLLVGAIPPVASLLASSLSGILGSVADSYGLATEVLVGVALALAALWVTAVVAGWLWRQAPGSARGYAAGATGLFAASLWAGELGVRPVAVFVGVAAALLAWDLGRNATVLRGQVGPAAPTREVEVTHATASVLVGGLAVVLATATVHLLGPATVGIGRGQAALAAILATVALLSFVALVDR